MNIIFKPSNVIISWGDTKRELESFISCKLISIKLIQQINDIDVQGYFNDWHDNLLENDYDHPLFDNKEMLCSYSRKSLEDRNHKWSLQMAITYVFREFLDKTRTQSSWSRSLDLSRLKRSFIPNMKQKTIVKQMIQYAVNDCLAVTKLTKLLDLT
ncbi:unnamed protein product [Rotaria magnacalcarata]|nr:unnamed protein product [Rotaria magnacalcarata]